MKYFFLCGLLCLNVAAISQTREVCFTIDDLPVVNYGIQEEAYLEGITAQLISHFDTYEIPAIGFLNETKLFREGGLSSFQLKLLEMWLKNGYELGNHTYSHMNYHAATFEDYTADIIKGEKESRPLIEKYGHELKYFRHPYLRVGLTKEKHDSLTQFLEQNGYEEAPVTIDNDDYLFAKAYHEALVMHDSATMSKIGKDYITYMEEKIHYFEGASQKLWNRNIKHILLLHANKLNADYLDELAEMYQKNGYDFISLKEALTDPVYQQEISRYGDWGISWIDRWALSMGKKGDFFKDDPTTPEYVKELAAQ